jgi:hypothetical protein
MSVPQAVDAERCEALSPSRRRYIQFLPALVVAAVCWTTMACLAQDRPGDADMASIIEQLTSRKKPAPAATFEARNIRREPDSDCEMEAATMKVSRGQEEKSFGVAIGRDARWMDPAVVLAVLPRLTVDADGAERAYHPEDPLAEGSCAEGSPTGADKEVCALDNFSDAGMRLFKGSTHLKTSKTAQQDATETDFLGSWKEMWPLVRDRTLKPLRLAKVVSKDGPSSYNIFHWKERDLTFAFNTDIVPQTVDGYPCRFGDESAHPGYFISSTTLKRPAGARRDGCRPRQFIDSETIPFFVLPARRLGRIALGDVVAGIAKDTYGVRIVYGIAADTGSYDHLGEGSIAFNSRLAGKSFTPSSGRETNALDIKVEMQGTGRYLAVVIFADTMRLLRHDLSARRIAQVGRKLFAAWNGGDDVRRGRLEKCLATAGNAAAIETGK